MAVITQNWGLDVALVVFPALVAAYLYMTRNFDYWRKKGVVEVPPIPFFGNFLDCCLLRTSPGAYFKSLYDRNKDLPYFGFYLFDKPSLVVGDPEIIKRILITDFNYFPNRYVSTHGSDNVAYANLFLLKNPAWKTVRTKISPIFTSGKMKKMFELMSVIGDNLITHLKSLKLTGDGTVIDVKDVSAKYTTDVISACAFGLQAGSLSNPDAAFRKCATNIFGFATFKRCAELRAFFFAPIIVRLLKLNFFSTEASDFMRKVFTKTINMRMETDTRKGDLIDLLIEVKKSRNHQTDDPDAFDFDGDNLVAQAATFFAAGYESSSSTMAFTLYELALQPNLQTRLREEIVSALAKSEGQLTYDLVMTLPYLDMVVAETLRMYPTLPFLDRVPIRDYQIPGTDLVIEEGTPVYVPVLGIHLNEKYFPEPNKYDPERFTSENKKSRPSCVYMPFGEGPHNCVGLRFGLLQAKLGILKYILNYEVNACAETPIPITLDPKAVLPAVDGGLFLRVRQITTPLED